MLEDDSYFRDLVLNEASKGKGRPAFTRQVGETNYNMQDPRHQMYDPLLVTELETRFPDWLFTDAERDEQRYLRGGYSRIEGKSLSDLNEELTSVYDEHYFPTSGPGYDGLTFEQMVDLFSSDDFYHCHYVARAYQSQMASECTPDGGIPSP